MMRRITLVAAVTFAADPALAGAAVAEDMNDCPRGRFCIWEDANFSGDMKAWSGSDRDYANNVWPGTTDGLDNEASSLWNRHACSVGVYDRAGASGEFEVHLSGASDGNLGNNDVGADEISAHQMIC
jgi:hypothetical protein